MADMANKSITVSPSRRGAALLKLGYTGDSNPSARVTAGLASSAGAPYTESVRVARIERAASRTPSERSTSELHPDRSRAAFGGKTVRVDPSLLGDDESGAA